MINKRRLINTFKQLVRIDSLSEVSRVLKFYMGKNTPERKQYIMDHLILRPV